MRKIAVGDLGEFWYGDYKEPFEQLEGAVPGHPIGVVLKDDDDKLLCAYCGKVYENLARHVNQAHGMSARAYKEEAGLLQKTALVNERLRIVRTGTALRRYRSGHADLTAMGGLGISRPHARDLHGKQNSAWTPERLNKTGRCYAQVLAVARTIQAQGTMVTQATLKRHGINHRTIVGYFGDRDPYEVLRRLIGAQPRLHHRWTDQELVTVYRSMAHDLGRTPTQSDMRRYGLPISSLGRRFSHETLCRLAGLPSNLPPPLDADRAVDILSAYAILGDVTKVAAKLGTTHRTVSSVFGRYGCPFSGYGQTAHQKREWAADMARRLSGIAA